MFHQCWKRIYKGIVVCVAIGLGAFFFLESGLFENKEIERLADKKTEDHHFLRQIEKELGYRATEHTRERMAERHIQGKEMYYGLKKGKRYYDPLHKNDVFRNEETGACIIVNHVEYCIVTVFRGAAKQRWRDRGPENNKITEKSGLR